MMHPTWIFATACAATGLLLLALACLRWGGVL
jgi:hypothetical protein